MSTLAPISSVPVLVRTTLLELLPPNMISPVPLMSWLPAPASTRSAPLPPVASVTWPPASTSPPVVTLSVALLPTVTLPVPAAPEPRVIPVKVTDWLVGSVTEVPALVTSVPLWIVVPL